MKGKKRFILVLAVAIAAGFGFFARAQTIAPASPSVPKSISATLIPPSQVSVAWSASTESSGIIEGYYVYRNGGEIVSTAGRSFVDSGLTPGVYLYTVAAYDVKGNVSAQSLPARVSVILDTTPPTTPKGVTIKGATSTNSSSALVPLTISWGVSTDNVGVKGYYVYRNGLNISTNKSSPITGTSVVDKAAAGTYTYAVTAYDAAQNISGKSVPATVTLTVSTNPPSVPADLSVQQVSATGVRLFWSTSTDPAGIAGYQVYRNGIQIASAGGHSYADAGLAAGKEYAYRIAAYDVAGNISGQSTPASIVIRPVSKPGAPHDLSAALFATSTVKLSWNPGAASLAVTGYTVYRNGVRVAFATSTGYLDGGLAARTYFYNVSMTDVSGAVSPTSSPVSVIVPGGNSVPAVASSSSAVYSPNVASGTPSGVAGAGSFLFTQSLSVGMSGAQVTALQQRLVADGFYAGPITGYYGTLTGVAVKEFQTAHGLAATGNVGPMTRAALNAGE